MIKTDLAVIIMITIAAVAFLLGFSLSPNGVPGKKAAVAAVGGYGEGGGYGEEGGWLR